MAYVTILSRGNNTTNKTGMEMGLEDRKNRNNKQVMEKRREGRRA
jgi:hypothetical protein